ncbi:MAG: EF-P lysine aminoacylase EpmA [Thermodesulfobacteriota bacterium]
MGTLRGLHLRASVIRAVRAFFEEAGYLEVDTPLRLPSLAPEPHIEPQESGSWFLQTSPELCMKRLLARGYPKIFQLCHCFRKGERGKRHLAEFAMLEWYRAGSDCHDLMAETEQLIRFVARELGMGEAVVYQGQRIELAAPWERLTVAAAFARYAPVSANEALQRGKFDEVLVEQIEPHLGQGRPTFLYDYPAALGSLARLKPGDPTVAERFELYFAGIELANGFSELTDPVEQRRRFVADQAAIRAQGRDPGPMPEKFLDEVSAMPEAAGIALGLDRLVMLFADAATIDQVVAFPPEQL